MSAVVSQIQAGLHHRPRMRALLLKAYLLVQKALRPHVHTTSAHIISISTPPRVHVNVQAPEPVKKALLGITRIARARRYAIQSELARKATNGASKLATA